MQLSKNQKEKSAAAFRSVWPLLGTPRLGGWSGSWKLPISTHGINEETDAQ